MTTDVNLLANICATNLPSPQGDKHQTVLAFDDNFEHVNIITISSVLIPGTINTDIGMLKRVLVRASVYHHLVVRLATALIMALCLSTVGFSQVDTIDDNAADPMKLFERGQNAHAKGEFERALEYYDEALKVRPEFPEAEFQRANALVSLKRFADAESAFKRAIELRPNWSPPFTNLGLLLIRLDRDDEAANLLRQALKLDAQNEVAMRVLAEVRLRAGDAKEALELSRKVTNRDSSAAAWIVKAMAERKLGLKTESLASIDHVLQSEPNNIVALIERADISIEAGNYSEAINNLRLAEQSAPGDKAIASRLASALEHVGRVEEAHKVAESAGLLKEDQLNADGTKVVGTPEEIEAANSSDVATARKALLKLLEKNPRSATLLARLGTSYRKEDAARSIDYYRRAAELMPDNAEYAVGYASALIQQRRFPEAINILNRVIKVNPDNYTAHANLATALYAQKDFATALLEYQWIVTNKPDVTIAYYFIATAYDNLGEYREALVAYENFIARADVQINQLEIEKVKLRLPTLKRQIQLGQGVKRKPSE
jgi:tetratricopeptide (TPR) repeat protein